MQYGQPTYGQQPHGQSSQQQQSTVVVMNQPNTQTTTRSGQQQNIQPWSTGLCGCFEDCSSCKR